MILLLFLWDGSARTPFDCNADMRPPLFLWPGQFRKAEIRDRIRIKKTACTSKVLRATRQTADCSLLCVPTFQRILLTLIPSHHSTFRRFLSMRILPFSGIVTKNDTKINFADLRQEASLQVMARQTRCTAAVVACNF